MQFTPDVRNVT